MLNLYNEESLAELTETELVVVKGLIEKYIKNNKMKFQTRAEGLFRNALVELKKQFTDYLQLNGVEHDWKISINITPEDIGIKYLQINKPKEEPVVVERFDGKYIKDDTVDASQAALSMAAAVPFNEITGNITLTDNYDDLFKDNDDD